METYCYCQANGNFFLYCPAGQSWCPEQNTCIPDCHSDCQCLNPTTTTTKSPDTTSSPRQPTTTTRYPDTTTRYPDTTTRYPATTTYPWQTTTSGYPYTTTRYPATTTYPWQTTTTGYPYTTTRYPATTTYPWQTTTTGYPYTTTKYPATTTYPWQTTTTGYPYSTTTTGYPYTTTRTTSTTTYPEGVCPEGWIESVEGCFLFQHTERISWREAQELCEYQGGYLAEIRTEDQQTFIESLAMLEEEFVGARPWFIGLTDFGHEGRYTYQEIGEERGRVSVCLKVDLAPLCPGG